ncbi:MAG TPA: hypothetical protein PL033_10330 [Candidatus Brocadiia bacterium]|nr:hypothetical protein [Candidatus Brocadiia bacterium]
MSARFVCIALASAFFAATAARADETLTHAGVSVAFSTENRTVSISDAEYGKLLDRIAVVSSNIKTRFSTDDVALKPSAVCDQERKELRLSLSNGFSITFRISDNGTVDVATVGEGFKDVIIEAESCLGEKAMPAILGDQEPDKQDVLFSTLGPAEVHSAKSLFDPERDLAITAFSESSVAWWRQNDRGKGPLRVIARAPCGKGLVSLKIRRHYYRDELGIKHYAPMRKRGAWQTAPVVAMTWYGIKGWEGKPAQRKEWLFPQVDWVAKNLLPYAERLVFQLDDNYLFNDDAYMCALSDYIRSKGLIPGIWFTPFAVAPESVAKDHPEWFLHDANGKFLHAFGGVNWNYGNKGAAVLNVNNPEAVAEWYGKFWRKASEAWNNDFFKIDGQPEVSDRYEKSSDGNGVEGYRKGLQIGREIVGEEKFINACWGTPVTAIGPVDGSRTGGDTGNDGHATDVVIRWNFLNNVCWWSDPDAAANLHTATVERARLNAQARVLTGQQFLTDDVWTSVPPEIMRVWQRSFPMLDIKPVNLYRIENWKKYDTFTLRIAKPWGTWDVVGLFNYEDAQVEKILDLARTGPVNPGMAVHVYDYWNAQYLGRHRSDAKILSHMAPLEGQLFAVVFPSHGGPVILSTSRHMSQGGLDLEKITWSRSAGDIKADGISTHLVKDDPYEVVFAAGSYRVKKASASSGTVKVVSDRGVARIVIQPELERCEWSVQFVPLEEPTILVSPETCHVGKNGRGEIRIENLGPKPIKWRASSPDGKIQITPPASDLGPAIQVSENTNATLYTPDNTVIAVKADPAGLDAGQTWTGKIKVEAEGVPAQEISVVMQVPLPENLSRKARAFASSAWPGGYEAVKINDGNASTRWNSREGDVSGCWVELAWDEPVVLDRVVIDECMEFGNRIESWRLEAWDGQSFKKIAEGKRAGRRLIVNLEKPVTTKRLQLVVDKASVVPTISELEAYRCRKCE